MTTKNKKTWSKAKCLADALRYRSRGHWAKFSSEAFKTARKKGWLKECCAHMTGKGTVWDIEQCKIDALRFKHASDWKASSGLNSGYHVAEEKGWLEECCSHMIPKPVAKPKLKWTLEFCKRDALKYKYKKNWLKHSKSVYMTAYRQGWHDECCAHMKESIKWTLEACKKDALKHSTRTHWRKAAMSGYAAAYRNGWLDECCAHMVKIKKTTNNHTIKWDLLACAKDALNYSCRGDWSISSGSAYNAARLNGWLEFCCEHMKDRRTAAKKHTIEECMTNARGYKHKSDWRKESGVMYKQAWRNGWLDECCAHMTRKSPPRTRQK